MTDAGLKRSLLLSIPFGMLGLLLVVLWTGVASTPMHLGAIKTFHAGSLGEWSANFSHEFFWYIGNLFVPHNIVYMANFVPLKGSLAVWNLLLAAFVAGCVFLVFYFKKSLESFALVFFLTGFICAFPASLIRLQGGDGWEMEPYWVYYSSMGFYLLVTLLIFRLKKYVHRTGFIALWSVILTLCLIGTINADITARAEIIYAQDWLRKFPNNPMARNIVTIFYLEHPKIKIPADLVPDVLNQIDTAIKVDSPGTYELIQRLSFYNLSLEQRNDLLIKSVAYDCMFGPTNRCDQLLPLVIDHLGNNVDSYMRLSYVFYRAGLNRQAVLLLQKCISLYPKEKEPYLFMGVILANENSYKEAIDIWEKGRNLDPTDPQFMANIDEARKLKSSNKIPV